MNNPQMIEMIRAIMTRFLRKKYSVTDQWTAKPDEDFLKVNDLSEKICKPANQVEIGTFARDSWEEMIF